MGPSLRKKLLRDLLRARASFGAAILVILLGVTLLGASYASYQNLLRSYQHSYDVLHFADFVTGLRNAGDDLPDLAADLPGVARVEPRLVGELPAMTPDGDSGGVSARIISVPAPDQPSVNGVLVYDGEYLSGAPREILLESSFAGYHGLAAGDSLRVMSQGEPVDLLIRGLVRTAEYILPARNKQNFMPQPRTFAIAYASHDTAVSLLGLPEPYNEVAVELEPGADREATIDLLAARVAPAVVTGTVVREDQTSNAALQMDLEGFREMALAFPLLFFGAAAITLVILLGRLVQAQTPVIGLMRAVGYGPRAVLSHYAGFGLVIGVIGGLLGSVLGFLIGGVTTRFYVQIINVPVLRIEPEWTSLAVGFASAVIVCLAAALLPAWRASRIQPADAMRGEVGLAAAGGTRIGSAWPASARIAVRNIFRNRLRSLYTAAGIAMAVVIIMISVAYHDTINALIAHEFDDVTPHDATVFFSTPTDESITDDIRQIPGVAIVEPMIQVPVELRANGERYSTLLMGIPGDATLWNLFDLGQERVAADEGLRLAGGLRQRLGVEVGDEIEVATFGYTATLPVVGFVEQMMGSNVYLSLPALQDRLGIGNRITGVMALAEPGHDREMVVALEKLPGVAYTSTAFGIKEVLDEFMGLFYGFIGMMILFAALLAFIMVFNTVTVSVMERRRELATMRMIGAGMGRVAGIVTIENLGIGMAGGLIGLVVGRLLADPAVHLFDSDAFTFSRSVVEPVTVAVVTLALLVVVLLSAIPGIRYIGRMDLAGVARERAT